MRYMFTKTKTSQKTKKLVRLTPTKKYDSDSDLSVPEDFDLTYKRRSRSAAQTAAKKLSASTKEWACDDSSGSSDFSGDNQPSSDDETSEGSIAPTCTGIPSGISNDNTDYSSSDSDSDGDLENRNALLRSRKRQSIALAAIKKALKNGSTSGKKTGKPQLKKKSFRKKESPESGTTHGFDIDPLRGIDMASLKEKAMEGCRASVLHTISWWRIVLDEAHNIK